MKKQIMGLAIALVLSLLVCPVVFAGGPMDGVQKPVNEVLEILRDPALKADSATAVKKEKIKAVIDRVFNYDQLSKRTLGRGWKKLNAEQQKEFTQLFTQLLSNVYMDRILAYSDEKVVFDKEEMLSEDKAEVQSRVVTASKEIPINYRMINKDGGWKAYDVIIEGVSLVSNYRTQFRQMLSKGTPEELIETLRKKVAS